MGSARDLILERETVLEILGFQPEADAQTAAQMVVNSRDALRADNARLREAAARLEMVRRWSDLVPYFDGWGDLRHILDGTTPIPADLKGEPK